jgi:beta-glucosidase
MKTEKQGTEERGGACGSRPLYLDPAAPFDRRAQDIVSRMTLAQKVSQMFNSARPEECVAREYRTRNGWMPCSLCWATAIPELGVPSYEWWNECLHGCASSWNATVFPQAIGMAATWNPDLIHKIGTAISNEARAKHHECLRTGKIEPHTGLTYWSPNVNIFRDPRWGRGQETYGEDPHLAARIAVAFVRALQGDDPKYLKLVATPKHFAVHSGPEKLRHSFDAHVSERDLRDTYLPVFEACVREGRAASVMAAYNRVNGEPAVASKRLLSGILRGEWGFDGFVVADNCATTDLHTGHRVTTTAAEAAALALKAGCDLDCGDVLGALVHAATQGLVKEDEIDSAVQRLFLARFRLGMFDPPALVPYANIPASVIDCEAHRELALETARRSMVLLKNEAGLLPLRDDLACIAVIGPNADDQDVLRGNYAGTPSREVTVLEGIRNRARRARVLHARGCDLSGASRAGFGEAVRIASQADVAIMVMGSSAAWESEENHAWDSELGDDRPHLDLPGVQEDLLKAVHDTGTPVVLVLMAGGGLAVNWADEHVPAIVTAWFPGEEGGTAVAEALFGDFSPGGRLPTTWYRSLEDLPPFEDYSMAGRTYRYFAGEPLYPFGYGLSYARFRYSDLRISPEQPEAGTSAQISVSVENVGERAADEVVQLYLSHLAPSHQTPLRALQGFRRVHLRPGQREAVAFTLSSAQMSVVDEAGDRIIEPGELAVSVGGGQPGSRGVRCGENVLAGALRILGRLALTSQPGSAHGE